MKIKELKDRSDIHPNTKLHATYTQFDTLLAELRTKTLTNETVNVINEGVDQINAASGSEKELRKQIRKVQLRIVKLIEKEHKLVTKNYYRNIWLAVGMSAFGIPIGLAFGLSLGNMGFLAIGFPIGMAIGIAVGTAMDKKALKEGRQLDIELNN